MLRKWLRSPAKKAYCGVGLMLIGLSPVYYTHLPFPLVYPGVVCVFSLAVLAFVFAFLEDWIDLTSGVKVELAWTYGAGAVLMMNGEQWMHDLLATWSPIPQWNDTLILIELAFPVMIAIPACVVFLGVFRYPKKWPERGYLLGGLALVILFVGAIWFNLFRIHFLGDTRLGFYEARFVWMPACLVVGTLGMLFGCLPHRSHQLAQLESTMCFCYLAGAALMALGLFWDDLALVAPLPAVLGAFAPASFMTWKWITTRFGERAY
jgi:hypothetical protein